MARYLSDSSLGYNVSKEKSHFPIFQSQQTQSFLLPSVLANYKFFDCRKETSVNGTTTKVYLPKADQILTEYAAESLPIHSTIAFIEMVDKLFTASPKISIFINTKLEYAIALYSNLYLVSTVTPEIRTILSAYFNNLGDNLFYSGLSLFTRTAQINRLKQSLAIIEKKYLEKLKNEVNLEGVRQYEPLPYQTNILLKPRKAEFTDQPTKQWLKTHQSDKVLSDESAQNFIKIANSEISTDINVEFETNRAKALGLAADIIGDPIFKMSLEDPRWNEYDETIKKEVAFYNRKFNGIAGYTPLDWRMIKAMVWTEVMAGPAGNSEQWQKFPLQIGRFSADPGYKVVSEGLDGSDLISSKELRQLLLDKSKGIGHNNIKAGIVYLYTRAIEGNVKWNENKVDNPQILTYITTNKDNKGYSGIAAKLETTVANLTENNPAVNPNNYQPGQELKYQKAHRERYISGWNDWISTIKNYNSDPKSGKGDSDYLIKFNKAYQIITMRAQ